MTRPRARILLVSLSLATLTAMLTAPAGIAAGAVDSRAQFSQSTASTAERQMFGAELIGKVTKAGKVGNIDAEVGDLVLREVYVPGGRGARTALGPATLQAATVLHGQHIRTINPPNTAYNYRQVAAIEENQSNQVRGYNKGHMLLGDTVRATIHDIASFLVFNWDHDSAGDGCGPYPTGDPCVYIKHPLVSGKVLDYYVLGTYRHKCGQAGWNCDNVWKTQTETWAWDDPTLDFWTWTGITCSYWWGVERGQGTIGCADG
jgi:hypothetical protein